jgi:tetratricopeptide (TPR) repeat protein
LDSGKLPLGVDSLVAILEKAVEGDSAHYDDELISYVGALVEVLANVGRGNQPHREEGLVELFEATLTQLFARGSRTADIRLMLARYSSALSNGGRQRFGIICAAIGESRDTDEKLRAVLVLAKYYIDISDYNNAYRYLDECEALAEEARNGALEAFDIHTTRGIGLFYNDIRLARRSLARGVSFELAPHYPTVCRATATALHYLGRIQATRGDHTGALIFLVAAQHFKGTLNLESAQLGYYHLRTGEILVAAGNTHAGKDHLVHAGRLFHNVHHRSTAEAQLNSTLAGIAAAEGDAGRAEKLLHDAVASARRDNYPRGELLFTLQILLVQLRRGAVAAAIKTAFRLMKIARGAEYGGVVWLARRVKASSFSFLFTSVWRRKKREPPDPLGCPCPLHLDVPMAELLDVIRESLPATS